MIAVIVAGILWTLVSIALWKIQSTAAPAYCADWRDRAVALLWPILLAPWLLYAFVLLAWKKGQCE
ncbi:MAG TPA: hypothetical protein VF463_10550 [Sphingobium sp.]